MSPAPYRKGLPNAEFQSRVASIASSRRGWERSSAPNANSYAAISGDTATRPNQIAATVYNNLRKATLVTTARDWTRKTVGKAKKAGNKKPDAMRAFAK